MPVSQDVYIKANFDFKMFGKNKTFAFNSGQVELLFVDENVSQNQRSMVNIMRNRLSFQSRSINNFCGIDLTRSTAQCHSLSPHFLSQQLFNLTCSRSPCISRRSTGGSATWFNSCTNISQQHDLSTNHSLSS